MQQPTIWQFSRMRSKGSRFTLGIFGVEGVFARRCATVRSPPFVWGPYGRASGSPEKLVTFEGFKGRATSFRVAGVALWHRNMFSWGDKRNMFARFSED